MAWRGSDWAFRLKWCRACAPVRQPSSARASCSEKAGSGCRRVACPCKRRRRCASAGAPCAAVSCAPANSAPAVSRMYPPPATPQCVALTFPFVALCCPGPRRTQLKRLSPNATYTEARTNVDNAAITCSFAECLCVTRLLARAMLHAHLRMPARVLVQRPMLFCLRCRAGARYLLCRPRGSLCSHGLLSSGLR